MSDLNDIKAAIANLSDEGGEKKQESRDGKAFAETKQNDPFREKMGEEPFRQAAQDPSSSGFVPEPLTVNRESSLEERDRIKQAAQSPPEAADPFPGTPPVPEAAVPMSPAPEVADPFPGTPAAPEAAVPMPPAPEATDPFPGTPPVPEAAVPMPPAPEVVDPFPVTPAAPEAVDPFPVTPPAPEAAESIPPAPEAAEPFPGTPPAPEAAVPMPPAPEAAEPFPGTPPAPEATVPMPPAPEAAEPFPGTPPAPEAAVPMPPTPEAAVPMPPAPGTTESFPNTPPETMDPFPGTPPETMDPFPGTPPGTAEPFPSTPQEGAIPMPAPEASNPFAGFQEPVDPFPDSGGYLLKQEDDMTIRAEEAIPMPPVDDPLSAVPEINPEGFAPLDGDSFTATPPPAEDYVPAYNEISEEVPEVPTTGGTDNPGVVLNSQDKIEPKDILLAISIVDPASDIEAKQEQALQNIRSDVSFGGKKKKPPKITTTPLPLDLLVPGAPLIGTIYSPSGGVGKSSTAMNLAVYIAAIAEVMAEQKRKKGDIDVRVPRVLILDGDIAQGSLALRLKGEVSPSIHTLQLYLDDRIAQGFEGENAWPSVYENAPPGEKAMRDFVMWNQKVTNLDLLAAPEEPDFFFDFGPGEYRDILRLLSRFYDVIIIDSGTEIIQESQRAWLQHAHEVFIITAPEIDRMYNASKATRYIARKRPHPQDTRENAPKMPALATKEKLSLVVTRADADSGLDVKGEVIPELFPWFDDSQKFYVPDVSQDMLRANNSGEFLVLNNPEYAEIISSLAEKLFARYAEMREKRSIEQPQALRQEA